MSSAEKSTRPNKISALFSRLRFADYLAVGVLAITAVLLLDAIRYGVHVPDECVYQTIPHRLILGDRLIIDEWHLFQITSFFHYLPFRFFYTVTGGTDGIVLAFRYLFVVVRLIYFCYLYVSLRQYGLWSVLCAVVFTGYNAFAFLTMNYYTMGYMAFVFVFIELLLKKRSSPPVLFFIGFVFACGVLLQPAAAVLYFAFTVFVLNRQIGIKKGKERFSGFGFVVNVRGWLFLTAGIALCAALFFIVILAGVDLQSFLRNFAELFGDSEYSLFDLHHNFLRYEKIEAFRIFYNIFFVAASWGCVFLSAVFNKKIKPYRSVLFPVFLGISIAALISVFFDGQVSRDYAVIHAMPLFVVNIGLICYLYTKEKNKILLVFLLIGCIFSFVEDIASEITIGNANIVAAVPAVLLFASVYKEIKSERMAQPAEKKQKLTYLSVTVLLVIFVLTESYHYLLVRSIHPEESFNVDPTAQLSETLTAGPFRGIRTIPEISEKYAAALRDMEIVKKETEGPFYAAGECAWYYLYVDHPYGIYSTNYVPADSQTRVLRYWELHPEKRPGCIYVPIYDTSQYEEDPEQAQKAIRFFETVCNFETIQGEAGYILKVSSWKIP